MSAFVQCSLAHCHDNETQWRQGRVRVLFDYIQQCMCFILKFSGCIVGNAMHRGSSHSGERALFLLRQKVLD